MRYLKTRNLRFAMNVASLLLLISGFIYCGINLVGGLTSKQESLSFKRKADFYQTRYDLAKERLPKTPVEPEKIKVAVDAITTLNEYKSTPYEMLSYIGKGLQQYPDIKLDDLNWSFSLDPNNDLKSPDSNNTLLLTSGTGNVDEYKYYQISNIEAHIDPFEGNYREAISLVNEFAETLRSFDSTYNITIESFPLDISSTATLQGDAESVGKVALFSIRAVIGVK